MAQIGTVQIVDGSGTVRDVPVYEPGDSQYHRIREFLRVDTGNGVGFIPTINLSSRESYPLQEFRVGSLFDETHISDAWTMYNDTNFTNHLFTDFENGSPAPDTYAYFGLSFTVSTSVQSDTVISGSQTLEVTADNAGVTYEMLREDTEQGRPDSIKATVRADGYAGNDDEIEIAFYNENGVDIGHLAFYGDGEIDWRPGEYTSRQYVQGWSPDTNYTCEFKNWDVANNTVDIRINGTDYGTFSTENTLGDGWHEAQFRNITTSSGVLSNMYLDEIYLNV